jgi:hypothetical protein
LRFLDPPLRVCFRSLQPLTPLPSRQHSAMPIARFRLAGNSTQQQAQFADHLTAALTDRFGFAEYLLAWSRHSPQVVAPTTKAPASEAAAAASAAAAGTTTTTTTTMTATTKKSGASSTLAPAAAPTAFAKGKETTAKVAAEPRRFSAKTTPLEVLQEEVKTHNDAWKVWLSKTEAGKVRVGAMRRWHC